MQVPEQQSAVVEHAPPSCAQLMPPDTQVPPWQTPPVQQSASVVHVPEPIAMHAPQAKPVDEVELGVQMPEQHSPPKLHAAPLE